MPEFSQELHRQPIDLAVIKIDFKLQEGILHILDVGPGLSAGDTGFEKTLHQQIYCDMQALTGLPVASIFGEYVKPLQEEGILDLPLICLNLDRIFRPEDAEVQPLKSNVVGGLYYFHEKIAYAMNELGLAPRHFNAMPISFSLLEQYKVIWYLLLKNQLKRNVTFWSTADAVDTDSFDDSLCPKGYVIKPAAHSARGQDVYYASNSIAAKEILSTLKTSSASKKLYIIEPAYISPKLNENGLTHNCTGRAFITISHNKSTGVINYKVAGSKWLLSKSPMPESRSTAKLTADHVVTNVLRMDSIINLTPDEKSSLNAGLEQYSAIFKLFFTNNDLLGLFCDHLAVSANWGFLVPRHSPYDLYIKILQEKKSSSYRDKVQFLVQLVIGQLKDLEFFQRFEVVMMKTDFSGGLNLPTLTNFLIHLTFARNLMKECNFHGIIMKPMMQFIDKDKLDVDKVNTKIKQLVGIYLKQKDKNYDTGDFNRALRQAASQGHLDVIKILFYTNLADVNAISPSGKKAIDFAVTPDCRQLLKHLSDLSEPGMTPDPDEEADCTRKIVVPLFAAAQASSSGSALLGQAELAKRQLSLRS